ncbi:peptide chain release factor eRF/aRF subunit 1 [Exidia glandulosa HHB12029]|uniref:Peptide chain release factor eRF/aRF subunit 1 n=1 Tax=Exidia glandulosa HHB12029 TaxID=1314781 RepID=A0A165D183_EXIGL|nr:peptide chain release factor eRF/aRF subunit 1 [Exidia glandulosa HHB12029]
MNQPTAEQNIQMWKLKRLIRSLDAARGAGTSMISLIIPAKGQIARTSGLLTQEYGTAANIKSHINKLSVQAAITSAQARLKLYPRLPPNGLCVFVGTILTEDNKEKKISFDFEPPKPVNNFVYFCGNKFSTDELVKLLETDSKFGFIVMDGNGALFATLSGNTREICHKVSVDLPKKHGRGGQSALRFSRLRDEARHNYVRKIAELAVQQFISNDKPNVAGLVLAGSADFKNELNSSDLFDPRLAAKVIRVVDVSYGGENGFNQAIELAGDSLSNVKFVQEKKLIQHYFDEISRDTGKYCFGMDDTLKALELGAVETLIVWESLDATRHVLVNAAGEEVVVHVTAGNAKDAEKMIDKSTGLEMEHASGSEPQSLIEWIAENYTKFGATLEFVTDKSQDGAQFVRGFGGIGGLLRYRLDLDSMNGTEEDEDEFETDDEDF